MPDPQRRADAAAGAPHERLQKKAWIAPAITQHDLLESVAALCASSPPLITAKTGGLTCNNLNS